MTDTMPVKLSFFAGLIVAIILEFKNVLSLLSSSSSILTNINKVINSFQGEFFFFILLFSVTFVWVFRETLYHNQNPLFENIKKWRYAIKVFSLFGLTVVYLLIWVLFKLNLINSTIIFFILFTLFFVSVIMMHIFKLGKARDPTEIDSIGKKLEEIHKEIKIIEKSLK